MCWDYADVAGLEFDYLDFARRPAREGNDFGS